MRLPWWKPAEVANPAPAPAELPKPVPADLPAPAELPRAPILPKLCRRSWTHPCRHRFLHKCRRRSTYRRPRSSIRRTSRRHRRLLRPLRRPHCLSCPHCPQRRRRCLRCRHRRRCCLRCRHPRRCPRCRTFPTCSEGSACRFEVRQGQAWSWPESGDSVHRRRPPLSATFAYGPPMLPDRSKGHRAVSPLTPRARHEFAGDNLCVLHLIFSPKTKRS